MMLKLGSCCLSLFMSLFTSLNRDSSDTSLVTSNEGIVSGVGVGGIVYTTSLLGEIDPLKYGGLFYL